MTNHGIKHAECCDEKIVRVLGVSKEYITFKPYLVGIEPLEFDADRILFAKVESI